MKTTPCKSCGAYWGAVVLSSLALWWAYGRYWADMLCWINANQPLAGWVQAVGSIAAVIGTWWATTYQIRKARLIQDALRVEQAKASMQRELDINKVCQELARDLEKLCEQHGNAMAFGNWQKLRDHVKAEELAGILSIIETYTSHYVPVRLAFKMIQLLRLGRAIAKQFDRHAEMDEIDEAVRDQFDKLRVAVCKARDEIKAQRAEVRAAYKSEGVQSAPDANDRADMASFVEDFDRQYAGFTAMQSQGLPLRK
jgi:hypothetical protein